MKRILLFLFILLTTTHYLHSQDDRAITGQVTDANDNAPLPGVTVLVKGTSIGAVTDINGNYRILVPNASSQLQFSFIGYVTQVVDLGVDNIINIALVSDTQSLEEVVVAALGVTKKKEKVSYAVTSIGSQDLNQSRIGDLSQQLSGQVAGLAINTNNGSGVSSSSLVLRGESSLNLAKNQPLLVIDGALVSNTYIGIGADAHTSGNLPVDYGNTMNDLNPDDIASVSVLKGPKAGAIYGSRASSGVLVITTKSGDQKKGLGIDISTGLSFDQVNRFWDEQNEYGGGGYNSSNQLYNQYRSNWGGNFGPKTDGSLVSQATPDDPSPAETPFRQKADRLGFFKTGMSQNYNVALSHSSENSNIRVSIGRLSKEGIVPNTDYKKTNIGLKLGYNITDKLSLDVSGNYISSSSSNVPELGFASRGGLMYSMLWVMKNFSLEDFKDYWVPGQEYKKQNYFLSWGTNPYLIVNENLNAFQHNRTLGNVKATYEITDNISAFARVALDTYDDIRTSRRAGGQPAYANGMHREQNINVYELNADFYITYNSNLSDMISLEANLGGNTYKQSITNKIVQTENLVIPGLFSLTNAGDTPSIDQSNPEKIINSIYGSTQVGYDDKLFIDLTARNDWSSTLPSPYSFFYPSVGISAVVSKMVDLPDVISLARLRTSWAQTGNDTDAFLTNSTFPLGTLAGSVSVPSLLPNTDLKPEQTSALEFGLDLSLLQNKINLTVDYYNNVSTNQILEADVSEASGASSKLINAGEINSSGIEVLLRATPIFKNDFSWDVTFNWTRNRAKVIKLDPQVKSLIIARGPSGTTIEARPDGLMGDIYGVGFARNNGQIIYKDVNGIAVPQTDSQKKKLGNYNPDWTAGLVNTLRYKNFTMRIFFDYRQGGVFYSRTSSQLYRSGSITETLKFRESNITPVGVLQNADGTFTNNTLTSPGYDYYRNYYNTANAEANTYDATFFKLRELSIGVDLTPYINNLGFQKLHLSIFGRNLWVWSSEEFVRHFDPEVMTFSGSNYVRGIEAGQLPGFATYGANVKIGF